MLDSVEDDVSGFKKFVPGESRFEISESDTLDNERKLSYDLVHVGDYKFLAESKGKGKFKINVECRNNKETIINSSATLSGKNGKVLEFEFTVEKHQIPLTFNVHLSGTSSFFNKAMYQFRLTKIEPIFPVATVEQVHSSRIKVKMCLESEIRIDYIERQGDELERLKKEYPNCIFKYLDKDGDRVTLGSSEDLKVFIAGLDPDKTPKIFVTKEGMTSSPSTPIMAPVFKTIRWQQGQKIGKGAFGVVHLGLNQDTGKLMAVKEVDIHGFDDKLETLESEIRLLSTLEHKNIVKYQGSQRTKEKLYIFMDYIPGGSIESVLKTFSKLEEPVVKIYTIQILKGIEYLHSKNILHRDIKTGNILLDEHGNVYLSDFGSAKKFTRELQRKEKVLEGSPVYMANEVIEFSRYTKSSDIYSLGCTVLEMLTGVAPFGDKLHNFHTPLEFFYWRREHKPKLTIPDSLSENAKSFIHACVSEYPENRKKASELAEHVFLSGKIEEDFESDDEIPEIHEIPSHDPSDGFDFDDIPSPLEKKKSLQQISSFLKTRAEDFK